MQIGNPDGSIHAETAWGNPVVTKKMIQAVKKAGFTNLKDADLSALPAGEKAVLELVALRLLCAVAQAHIYSETVVIAACAGGEFTAKGKTVKHPGW